MRESLPVDGRIVCLAESALELDHPVKQAFQLDASRIVVLYDPDASTGAEGQFRNLVAITVTGDEVWTGELPTNQNGDVYTKISSTTPLEAFSWTSFRCEIDKTTGKLIRKEFVK
jgi:hypothetical protein